MTQVSVVMPAYNAVSFIGRAVESVLAQTHTDWELIVVDDGSTDGSEEVVRGYTDVRIRCMRQANQGPAAARNLGLAESQGDYVIFLDADDWWDRRCLERLVDALRRANARDAVAHADWAYASATGQTGPVVSSTVAENAALATLFLRNPIAVHCALVRRSALQAVGGFPSETPSLEDWELWLRLAAAGYGFVHVPELLAFYCWRPGSKGKDLERRKADRLATLGRLWSWPGLSERTCALKAASYAAAHIDFCISYLSQGNEALSLQEFDSAVQHDSCVANSVDAYYRIALGEHGTVSTGIGGSAAEFDAAVAHCRIQVMLAHLEKTWPKVDAQSAGAAAYRALGLACYVERRLASARRFWLQSLRLRPGKFITSRMSLAFVRSVLRSLNGEEASTGVQAS